jgi:hypothetical protein
MPAWRTIGAVVLGLLAALAVFGGADCLRVGLPDLRTAQREYDWRVGLYVVLSGCGLLVAGGLLGWASWALWPR